MALGVSLAFFDVKMRGIVKDFMRRDVELERPWETVTRLAEVFASKLVASGLTCRESL